MRFHLTAVFLFLFSIPLALVAKDLTFIALGDTPYSDAENVRLKEEVAPAIAKAAPPFVIHYGDLKGGGEICSDEILSERRDYIYALRKDRVFYTPGDNEWTDCDRSFLSVRYSELERLDYVRQLFFAKPINVPQSWEYARQPNFPENARWMVDGIMFATVHLVSTNNGRIEILMDDIEAALAYVEARDQANRVWIDETFSAALKQKAEALVIATQADVTSPDAAGPCTDQNRMQCDAFGAFRDQLRLRAGDFHDRGKPRRPVLLLHGDTNPYCWDRTFGGTRAPNLWRLNAWGDFAAPADATQITVHPNDNKSPFSAKTLLGGLIPANSCE